MLQMRKNVLYRRQKVCAEISADKILSIAFLNFTNPLFKLTDDFTKVDSVYSKLNGV